MKIGIGIDTGGTCTDAVAYDFETGAVLAKGKVLTTRENLALGIGRALDALPPDMIRDATLISLSTTLATNACVENKGCRAKLLVFGMTDEMLRRANAEKEFGLKSESVKGIDTHGSYDGLIVDEPDWDLFLTENGDWLSDADAFAAAEMYSMNNGAKCEKHSKKLLEERYGLTFVAASDLSSDINVLARGATALLNARLLPIVREFIEAALSDFAARNCKAPVMIVRSDGSLMSAELSLSRPVETILSGPAASVLAGRSFTAEDDYLIVDMGGTTTDVSIVHNGKPAMADKGIKIGGWRTHVKGVYVDTFALGGDSAVRIDGGKLQLQPRRVMSICLASQRWPEIKTMLRELLSVKRVHKLPLHEFLYLVSEPAEPKRYGAEELLLIEALKKGPCMLSAVKEKLDIDLYRLDSERLEAEGIVMRCGLTPTDFMHIKGDYNDYDREASELAASYFLRCLGRPDNPGELISLADEVYGLVEGYMYESLLRILLVHKYPNQFERGLDKQTEFLIRESWAKRNAEAYNLLSYKFGSKAALVGIGAPTHVFLPAVAKALGAACVLPENAEVANAIGALRADIDAVVKVEISKIVMSSGDTYYIVHAPAGSRRFDILEEALSAAKAASEEAALKEARARGALGQLAVSTTISNNHISNGRGIIDMGFTAVSEVTVRFGKE
jgi:N-methylhydantoinase A/oxoprolinase/acetone carboxylase beta subunit